MGQDHQKEAERPASEKAESKERPNGPSHAIFGYNLTNPTIIIASLTAFLFFEGYTYYSSFFGVLGIPIINIDLPFTFYVSVAIFMVNLIMMISIYWPLDVPPRNRLPRKKAILRLILWLVTFALSYVILTEMGAFNLFPLASFQTLPWLTLILLLFLSEMVNIFWNKSIRSYVENYFNKIKISPHAVVIALISIAFLISVPIGLMGNIDANRLIEGKTSAIEISLDLKDLGEGELQNKTLFLLMFKDGAYYVIEKNDSFPSATKSYIVPSNNVRYATLKKNDYVRHSTMNTYAPWIEKINIWFKYLKEIPLNRYSISSNNTAYNL